MERGAVKMERIRIGTRTLLSLEGSFVVEHEAIEDARSTRVREDGRSDVST